MEPCGQLTVNGNICEQARAHGLPCCANHIGVWALDDSARLFCVFTTLAVVRVQPRCGSTAGQPIVRTFPEVQVLIASTSNTTGCDVRMNLDDAMVIADLVCSRGDSESATAILHAVESARAEWPERSAQRPMGI